jgi:hypothetical protein
MERGGERKKRKGKREYPKQQEKIKYGNENDQGKFFLRPSLLDLHCFPIFNESAWCQGEAQG